MFGAAPLVALVLAAAAVPGDVKNPALAEGIRLYDASDYADALQSLTLALDQPSSKRDLARVHLYIGLIQHQYQLKADAEASFGKALQHDPKVQPPKNATAGARALFLEVQRQKLGRPPDAEQERARIEAAKKRAAKALAARKSRDEAEGRRDAAAALETKTATKGAGLDAGALAAAEVRAGSAERTSKVSADAGQAGLPAPNLADPRARRATDLVTAPPERASRVAPWVAAGVGVAAIAAGTTLGVLATKNGQDAEAEPVAYRAEELHGTAVEQRTFALVALGVAGAALGLAAVLYFSGE